ncbi:MULTISPECIES: GNAT family protein [unclassified Mesorhizobium]|jgi:RimJ/RimL family protein N-acetyltransferase|uniref:GNAT family N-acetyltransferase n=1 Tax=unclassified Mesorhizobium TaxID=325217 RepID=UPI00095A5B51|nr:MULTISPECIES: GNAT family protein [unclassified Mesorhizobium]MBN9258350.1 GNAT family N-acetyltransferase [Mesorhizobium sp.]MBN9270312.1 GNAT family N-acetyltransferase [Mesorhizobium sp.]OJX73657.1 MAG: GNAT family N-acetyltransferase [Mesorhizobium sp. 65-26]
MVAEAEDTDDESYAIDRPELATERLVMRAPRESDVAQLALLADNRHVAEMLARMPHPYGEAEARSFLAMARARRAGIVYALTLAGTDTFVGCAGLNSTDRGLELGYWIGEPYWKRGYATEAAHALVDLAFQRTPIQVLHASTRVINPASRRVIHKCGFQYAGQGMLNSIVAGQVPVERYRLDRKTWTSLRNWVHF